MTIADKIKKARKAAGLKQKELADKLGVSPQMISQYENSGRIPKYETLCKIANAIGVPEEYLLGKDFAEQFEVLKVSGLTESEALEATLKLIECIYLSVEVKEICTGDNSASISTPYYIVGDSFILHENHIKTIKETLLAVIPPIIDGIKDDRSENEIRSEILEEHKQIKTT